MGDPVLMSTWHQSLTSHSGIQGATKVPIDGGCCCIDEDGDAHHGSSPNRKGKWKELLNYALIRYTCRSSLFTSLICLSEGREHAYTMNSHLHHFLTQRNTFIAQLTQCTVPQQWQAE